nr:hypothetical protein [Tanacetum cinerariifolium]
THEFANKVDELKALFGHVLRASRVQVLKDNLDDLQWTREEDREVETVDPQFVLGSLLLEGLDLKILGGTIGLDVILVKRHSFPSMEKVRPVDSLYELPYFLATKEKEVLNLAYPSLG